MKIWQYYFYEVILCFLANVYGHFSPDRTEARCLAPWLEMCYFTHRGEEKPAVIQVGALCENLKTEVKGFFFFQFVLYIFNKWSLTVKQQPVLVIVHWWYAKLTHRQPLSLPSMTDDVKLPGYWQMCFTRLGWMLLTELSTLVLRSFS